MEVAAAGFEQSFELVVNYEKRISIKSSITCRFVVFGDDGLIRMCFSHNDSVVRFEDLRPTIEDVSHLLITTDLFDSF